jgi:hypothetical protein
MEQKDLLGLSRSPLLNQLHALKEAIFKPAPKHNMHGYMPQNKLVWIWKNLLHLGNTHYPYQIYQRPEENNGVFIMPDEPELSIALLSDWASDTPESCNVASLCSSVLRDFSIHLGDTYYVGNEKEISCNFNSTTGGPWPYGKRGSFALLGNHEMYSSGKSYFTQLLPYMAMSENGEVKNQEASFFCLQNKYWQIIGLDTGYYSLKGFLGISANTDLELHPKHLEWLENVVQPGKDNRGIILLSHHQPISAFDKEVYPRPVQQIAKLFSPDRPVIWFWGHEHRLSVYGQNMLGERMNVFGRCIGHGGMPVTVGDQPGISKPMNNLVTYDARTREMIDGTAIGHNGYVVLKLAGPELTATYYDDNDGKNNQERMILEEKWKWEDGKIQGASITDFTTNWPDGQRLQPVQSIEQAIGKTPQKIPPLV